MKICDCCGKEFQYDEVTSRTDGGYHTVKLNKMNVRVSVNVKATNPLTSDFADICPDCRVQAIAEVINGRALP